MCRADSQLRAKMLRQRVARQEMTARRGIRETGRSGGDTTGGVGTTLTDDGANGSVLPLATKTAADF